MVLHLDAGPERHLRIRSRAVDDSGNVETPGAGRTLVVGSGAPAATSLWDGTGVPALVNQNDGQAIGLGVKFRTSIGGQVTGLRFYKGNLDTGTHVGRLWSSTGTVLATATFSGETASGWQQVLLTPPVTISPNTTYVATYHSTAGYYVASESYFTTARVNGPLTALANGTDGPNGVYRYGSANFPDLGYQASNYWADVVFVADVSPPTVTATSPAAGATGVPVGANATATFSEALVPATVNAANVLLRDPAQQLVPAVVTWDAATRTATLNPSADLAYSTAYTAVVKGGAGGVTDIAGNPMAADFSWTFTTDAAPPRTSRPRR